ncbi:MAG TPA: hypothetical protein VGJ84_18270 [Polyangiaceae bacterium]|jgi:hypothetical protein
MTTGPGDRLAHIEQLLEAGDLAAVRAALRSVDKSDERFLVLEIRVGLLESSLSPDLAMQRLIALMRKNPDLRGAKAAYQLASSLAYQHRESSISHSHPPPPIREGGEGNE